MGGFLSAIGVVRADGSAVACRATLFFVQGKGIDVAAVGCLWSGAEVEDPNDLSMVNV